VLTIILGIHVIVARMFGLGLEKVLPLVVEQPLKFNTRSVHGRINAIETETVANHETLQSGDAG